MKSFLFIIPVFSSLSFLPAAELKPVDVGAFGLAKPGISFEAGFSGSADSEAGMLDSEWVRLNAPLYKWDLAERTLLAVGVTYGFTRLDWQPTGAGQDLAFEADLHQVGGQLSFASLPQNTGVMSIIQAGVNYSGNSGELGSHSPDASLLGVFGWQFSPKLVLALAGYARWEADEVNAYPGLGLIWRPTDRWLLWLSPPAPSITYAVTDDWRVGLAAWPTGGRWHVGASDTGERVVEKEAFRGGLTVEHDFSKHLSLSVRGGLEFSSEFSLEDDSGRSIEQTTLDDTWFIALGINWNF